MKACSNQKMALDAKDWKFIDETGDERAAQANQQSSTVGPNAKLRSSSVEEQADNALDQAKRNYQCSVERVANA